MKKSKKTTRPGFTVLELIVAIITGVIVIFAVSVTLVDSTRSYSVTYNRANADVITDSYIARRLFDSRIRKSSAEELALDADGQWVEVAYYRYEFSTYPDRYARMYVLNDELNLEEGLINSEGEKQKIGDSIICRNVSSCVFRQTGRSVQMILVLDDGTKTNTIISSAVMHN